MIFTEQEDDTEQDEINASVSRSATADLLNSLSSIQKSDISDTEADCVAVALRGLSKLDSQETDAISDVILFLAKADLKEEEDVSVAKSSSADDGDTGDNPKLTAALEALSERIAIVEKARGVKKSLSSNEDSNKSDLLWPSFAAQTQ